MLEKWLCIRSYEMKETRSGCPGSLMRTRGWDQSEVCLRAGPARGKFQRVREHRSTEQQQLVVSVETQGRQEARAARIEPKGSQSNSRLNLRGRSGWHSCSRTLAIPCSPERRKLVGGATGDYALVNMVRF